MSRFEAILDPCGTWFVFDMLRGTPAEVGRRSLVGMNRHDAVLLATMLEGGRPGRRRPDMGAPREIERDNYRSKLLRQTAPPVRYGR